jgi:NTE family protein
MHGVPRPPRRRGLVLGAGAALGGAWTIGVLCALADTEGWDPTGVDVVVGTSAGSVLAALIGHGVPPRVMAQTLCGLDGEPSQSPGTGRPQVLDPVARAAVGIPRPFPVPGNVRLVAHALGRPGPCKGRRTVAGLVPRGRGDLAPVRELVEAHGGGEWPQRPRIWAVAMDYDDGRRVAFGAPGAPAAALPEAVVASCSVPGLFPPRVVGGRRYVDGGAFSATNADVLVGERLDEVTVLAPMGMDRSDRPRSAAARLDRRLRRHVTDQLWREVARLASGGTSVRVFTPTAEDLVAMGTNLMDAGRRSIVHATAVRTTTNRLGLLDGVAA